MAGMYTAKLNSIRDIVRLVSEGEEQMLVREAAPEQKVKRRGRCW